MKINKRGSNLAYGIRSRERPENLGASLSYLFKLVNLDLSYFVFLIISALGTTLIGLIIPLVLGKLIDGISLNMDGPALKNFQILIGVLGLTYILDMFFKILNERIIVKISQVSIYRIREAMFAKLERLALSYFYREKQGDIMSRISNDIEDISTSISQAFADLIISTLSLVGSVFLMFKLSLPLASLSLSTIPITYGLGKFVSKRTRLLFRERQKLLGALNSTMEESISSLETIRAFNRQEYFIDRFRQENNEFRRVSIRAQILAGLMMPLMNVVKNLNFTIIAVVGGYLASQGRITVGIITSFIAYSRQFSRPLNEIANTFNILQSGMAGVDRIMEVIKEEEEDLNLESKVLAEDLRGEIEFKNIDFSYVEGEKILDKVSFKVEAGKNIALVGETGAGKTTIINLLTGFFTGYSGEILIDNINIKDYNARSLRDNFGVVLQDTYLFSTSILDNISYGKLDASEEELVRASKNSGAYDFIKVLPKGFNTLLSQGGKNLSAGERQLIAISRALIKEPRILVFDEATSSIDTKTEVLIQEAMKEIMKGRTSIIIAHRLSTIINSDRILVLDKGRIIESGSHFELLEKRGYYYRLYLNQVGG